MKHIILASTSPRREELMEKLGIPFQTEASNYEEDMKKKMTPKRLAEFLASGKAEAVADNHTNSLVIGADTFVALRNELLGKPYTEEAAKKMLKRISGKALSIITGFAIIDSDTHKKVSGSVETKVVIKKLTRDEINNYVKSKEPLDKAGAFAIQGLGALLIKKIEGDYLGAIGLPLAEVAEGLKKFGVKIL